MNNTSEVEQVKARYARRADLGEADRYSMLDPAVWQSVQERQRALISLLRSNAQNPLTDLRVLEIGCGSGGNLLELLRMRFDPNKLVGNELLEDRASLARRNLPSAVDLHVGDATALTFEPGSFDVVYQSTVFSSLLDDSFQELLAQKMWEWVSSGGGALVRLYLQKSQQSRCKRRNFASNRRFVPRRRNRCPTRDACAAYQSSCL